MQKLYIPLVQTQQAKVIPLNASPLDEWISLEEACKLFTTRKHPNGILPESLKNKCHRRELPAYSYVRSVTGWRFHKPTLLGLKVIPFFSPAA